MAILEIKHKCVTLARAESRRDSRARLTGQSVFIKRYYGRYRLIGVTVSKAQRSCRDIFADAQKLAAKDMQTWNRKRHWKREAKRHKVKCGHRMAVSYFYRLLKENGGELSAELSKCRDNYRKNTNIAIVSMIDYEKQMDEQSPFYYRKFGDIDEYYGAVMRLAG